MRSLVQRGYSHVTVLDISQAAIAEAKSMMGIASESVNWVVADILKWEPTETYSYWYDRAVFHF